MAETKLQIESRVDRVELAIQAMSERLGNAEEVDKILRGETPKEKEDAGT